MSVDGKFILGVLLCKGYTIFGCVGSHPIATGESTEWGKTSETLIQGRGSREARFTKEGDEEF